MRAHSLGLWLAAALLLALLPPGAARAAPFRAYYDQHEGLRLLGYPLTGLVEANGHQAQYFEKGRLEDHRVERGGASWDFMFGRVAAELIERGGSLFVSSTNLTYTELRRHHEQARRRPAPAGFTAGTAQTDDGVFVPYDSQLHPAPGYIVTAYFWDYITRTDLFPTGWLHDIGLPMTDAFIVQVWKSGQRRPITVQAFERAVLTYDPRNPQAWQVERGNIGADMARLLPPANTIDLPKAGERVTLPLHVLARIGQPGQRLSVTLRWECGTRLLRNFTTLTEPDGHGILIDSMDIAPESLPQQPWTQPATLEIRDEWGVLLAQRQLVVLSPDDPDTSEIKLYWVADNHIKVGLRRVVRTEAIAATALDELLRGPSPSSDPGVETALPTPAQVLAFSARTGEWDPRVGLRKLTIVDGVAQADFSPELRAFAGDRLRGSMIHAQITHTLSQFEQVRDVQITVAGVRDTMIEP